VTDLQAVDLGPSADDVSCMLTYSLTYG